MQCFVAKNRSGKMGKFNIVFCRTYNRFEDESLHPDLVEQYEMATRRNRSREGRVAAMYGGV